MDTDGAQSGPTAEAAPASWADLAHRIATALDRLRRDQYLVFDWPGRHRFVQFAADGAEALRAEAVGAAYLAAGEELDPEQQRALPAAGSHAPTHDPDAQADEVVAGGSPNYIADFESRADFARAARLAVHTLCDIFRVPSPAALELHAFQGGVGLADIDECFEQVCRRSETAPAAQEQPHDDGDQRLALLRAVRTATRIADVEPDADGDIALGLGGRTVYVVWLPDPRLVLVRSALLTGGRADRATARDAGRPERPDDLGTVQLAGGGGLRRPVHAGTSLRSRFDAPGTAALRGGHRRPR